MMGLLPYKNTFPRLGDDVFIAPGAWLIGDVVIGNGSSVWFNTLVRGDMHFIRIGAETNIQDNSTLHVTGDKFPLVIGDRVTVGHRAIVHGCVVEDDCMIGMGSIVMDGAKIGAGSLVGAGAVVTPGTVVPPGSLVLGTPAKVARPVNDRERHLIVDAAAHYGDLARDYLSATRDHDAKRIKGFLG
jgi:carbonic anhydrase/acetyltransferase-like protein (isoleucine patch superfamily)